MHWNTETFVLSTNLPNSRVLYGIEPTGKDHLQMILFGHRTLSDSDAIQLDLIGIRIRPPHFASSESSDTPYTADQTR